MHRISYGYLGSMCETQTCISRSTIMKTFSRFNLTGICSFCFALTSAWFLLDCVSCCCAIGSGAHPAPHNTTCSHSHLGQIALEYRISASSRASIPDINTCRRRSAHLGSLILFETQTEPMPEEFMCKLGAYGEKRHKKVRGIDTSTVQRRSVKLCAAQRRSMRT